MPPTRLQPEILADDLANPPADFMLTDPQPEGPLRSNPTIGAVRGETDNLIAAQTKEAEQLAKLRDERAAFGLQQSLGDYRTDLNKQFELPENLRQLKDINLQLADMQEQSDFKKVDIAGGPGQTLGQAYREVTQEDRRFAVRSSALAARAAVLQGNIETASALIDDAVNTAFQDRQLNNQNIRDQITDLSGVVSEQTQQLLDARQRELDAEDARIEELKGNISAALLAGASTSEVAQLTGDRLTDDQKLALAQSIQAREARFDIGQERELRTAQINSANRANQGGANSDLDRRLKLLDLAAVGDPAAIAELGYDPNNVGGVESAIKLEREEASVTADLQVLDRMLSNNSGLELSSGANKSPLAASIATGGLVAPALYPIYKTQKEDFLGDVSYIVNSTTFGEVLRMREEGITFGNMTEGERIAAGRAANELNSRVTINEDGTVTDIRGSEGELRRIVNDLKIPFNEKIEDIRSQKAFSSDEDDEITSEYNRN